MSWIDDIGQEGFFKGMADAMKAGSSPGFGGPATPRLTGKDEKAFKDFIKNIKDTTSPLQTYNNLLQMQKVQTVDITETIKKFDQALEEATDAEDIAVLQEQKNQAIRAQTNQNLKASATNLTIGFAKATGTILRGTIDYAKNLLAGQDGITAAGNLAASQARATGEAISSVGSAISSLSSLATLLPVGRALKIAFMALTAVIGPLIEMLGTKAAELAEEGIKILTEELVKTRDNFQKINSAGVSFAGGMGEMRAAAGNAGMTLVQFSDFIKNNTESLAAMGMSLTDATKRIGGVSKVLRSGQLGDQLYNLGIAIKDQAGVAAEAAAMLQNSGQLRKMSDTQVAQATVQYAKDLKVLQEITGEDAKKKLEEARKETMRADIRAQLMKKDPTGEAVKRFERVYANMAAYGTDAQAGLLQLVSSGGTAMSNIQANIAAAQNENFGKLLKDGYSIITDNTLSATRAQDKFTESMRAASVATKNNADQYASMGLAVTMGAGDAFAGANSIQSALISAGVRLEEGSTQVVRDTVDLQSKTGDALTGSVRELDKATQKQTVAIEQLTTTALIPFAQHLKDTLDPIDKFIEKINAALDKIKTDTENKTAEGVDEKQRSQMFMGEKALSYGAQLIENTVGLVSESAKKSMRADRQAAEKTWVQDRASAVKKGAANYSKMTDSEKSVSDLAMAVEDLTSFVPLLGPMLAEKMFQSRVDAQEKYLNETSKAEREKKGFVRNLFGFSKGGISDRPAIFGEKGPEAAVPLPDGRTIPVTLRLPDFGSIASSNDTASAIPAAISSAISEMYNKMAQPATNQANDTILQEIRDIMQTQITKHDEMITQLRDQVDINQRILSAYS